MCKVLLITKTAKLNIRKMLPTQYAYILFCINFRYGFLVFSYDEVMKPSRDSCRMLLLRLKLDGWALGKSKVFLKYYHVELLARIYEEQVILNL